MPIIKSNELYKQWRAGNVKPAYVFSGDEEYLRNEALDRLEKALKIDPMGKELYIGNELRVEDLIMSAQTLPFLCEKKLLIVRDAHKMKVGVQKELSAFLKDASLNIACIIFMWSDNLRGKKTEFITTVSTVGDCVEFRQPYENELPSWIVEECKTHNKKISSDAVRYLVQETEPSLFDLHNEVAKLALYASSSEMITLEDVQALSGHSRQHDLNSLSQAVEQNNRARAVAVAEHLINEGEVPLRILATIYRVIRRLLIARSLMDEKNYSAASIRQELRLHNYFDKQFFTHLARFNMPMLSRAIKKIMAADVTLKSSNQPPLLVIEELLVSMLK